MIYYLSMAAQCAAGRDYWSPIRPQGFILYASLPYRMGWPVESIILMNLLLITASVWMAGRAWNILVPALKSRSWFFSAFKYVFIAVSHLVFMWGVARLAISDVPAACAALMAIWLAILALGRNSAWALAASGLALGVACSFRVFYCYPANFLGLAVVWACFGLRRVSSSALAAFVLLAAFPIFCQYAVTYRHTGSWSLLEPASTAFYENEEMGLAAYGVGAQNTDPVYGVDGVGNDQMHWYTCSDCMQGGGGWPGALARWDIKGIVKLAWARNEFYFGSWVARPALLDLNERVFSPWISLANWLAVLCATSILFRLKKTWVLGVPLIFAASVWGLSIVIHPESRFIMAILALAWSLSPLAWFAGRPGASPEGLEPQSRAQTADISAA